MCVTIKREIVSAQQTKGQQNRLDNESFTVYLSLLRPTIHPISRKPARYFPIHQMMRVESA